MYNKLFMNFLKQNEPTCNCYTKQVYTRAHDREGGEKACNRRGCRSWQNLLCAKNRTTDSCQIIINYYYSYYLYM